MDNADATRRINFEDTGILDWDQLEICVKEKREIKKYGVPFPKEIINHSPVSLSCPWGPSPTSSVAVESAATGKERTE